MNSTKHTTRAMVLLAGLALTSSSTLASGPQSAATMTPSAPSRFADGALLRTDANAALDTALLGFSGMQLPDGDGGFDVRAASAAPVGVTYDVRTGAESESLVAETGAPVLSIPGFAGLAKGESHVVVGTDERAPVADTTAFPWRAVCRVYATFPDNAQLTGTGTLVSAKHVLTAGHVVYSHEHGGWAKTVRVVPGLDGAYTPFGDHHVFKMRAFANFTTAKDPAFDIALLSLGEDVGTTTGWFGVGKAGKLANKPLRLAGFPTDIDSGTQMYAGNGPATSTDATFVYYGIDAGAGQNGAALQRDAKGQTYVSAVHIGSKNGANRGVLMNGPRLEYVKSWIASGE
jgi:V8-like Glu-specific endopeptidase